MTPSDQFREAINSAGLTPPDVIEPGKFHKFPGEGKRQGNTAGWCKLFPDEMGGIFGDYSTGLSTDWQATRNKPRTQAEREAFMRQVAEAKAQAEADQKARHAEAATKAGGIWKAATPAPEDHPYLARKKVKPHGARLYKDALVIPLLVGGVVHSLQFIAHDGTKKFLTDGRISGCYFSIGNPKDASALCIAEGFATGASIHEATGHPVAVAFNAGNLLPVAQAMREKFPDLPLILCADDDYQTEGNPGMTKANEAAQSVGGKVAIPAFGTSRPEKATDFNDMVSIHDMEAVKRAIDGASVPAIADRQPGAINPLGSDLWPDPLPIPDALPAVRAFDYSLLPDSLRPWIEDIAERVQCPPDFPAVGAMISLSAVVGRKIGIRPKRRDDWLEVPNLWGAIVGRPGVMKSPALRESMRPLRKLEGIAAELFETDTRGWRREQEMAKIRHEAARSKAVSDLKKGKDISPDALGDDFDDDQPQARRYVVNDCSVEALGEILRYNPNGTLAYRDELIGLLKSLDKEGQEGARGFYLSAWSGTDGYTFDRIGRGLNMRIDSCCLSLLGSIQPAIIGQYLRQAVAGAGGDGLISRFQLLVWPDIAGDWRDVDRWPDTDAKATAYDTFERLDTLDPIKAGAIIEDGNIPYLRFDDAAQELFSEWRGEFEQRIRSGNDHAAFESHLAKYRKLVPALSLLIHLADNQGAGAIGETALLQALAWAEYLEAHASRCYASVTQAEAESARALLSRIRKGEVPDPFTPRDVYLKHWAYLGTPEATHEAVRLLCDLDYLAKDEITTPGRKRTEYSINPKVRQP
jgi:putative DNA primase/helicase